MPIAGFKGPTFKEKGERKGRGRRGRKVVRGEEGKGKMEGERVDIVWPHL